MTSSDQSLPEMPPGIDPEVQARIDALLAQPPVVNSARQMAGGRTDDDGVVSYFDATTAPPQDILDAQTSNGGLSPTSDPSINMFKPEGKMDEDNDEGIWYERARWVPPPLPPRQAVPYLGDPSKVSRSETSRYQVISDVFPLTHFMPAPSTSPPLPPPSPTLFKRAVSYIGSYFSISPGIIEYSNAEIKRKAQVYIEARKWFVPNVPTQDPIVKVVAILTDISPTGGNLGECELVERPIEMLAKHRRVREIRRGVGCYIAEDVYGKEIRVALRRLKRQGV